MRPPRGGSRSRQRAPDGMDARGDLIRDRWQRPGSSKPGVGVAEAGAREDPGPGGRTGNW